MLTFESALTDTSYDLELEKIKNKIVKLYNELVERTYRASNPAASSEDIEKFLEDNALEFKGNGFSEEADGLENILDLLIQDEDLDKVSDREYEKSEVQNGSKLKASKEKSTAPKTSAFKFPKGGLLTPKDSRKKVTTQGLEAPRGSIKRVVDDNPKIDISSIQEILDIERNKLLELVRKRNKEHGVKFW
jgi:hypothetical protein